MANGARMVDPIKAALNHVPAAATAEYAKAFNVIAEKHGGSFFKGRYHLFSEVAEVYSKGATSNMIIVGKPAGFWAIKSFGRRGGYKVAPRRRKALTLFSSGGVQFATTAFPGPARGKDNWAKTLAEASTELPDIVLKQLKKKVN
jgi:hypothetical protein